MNLYQLRYFQKLAEVRHFGNAAKELFISQPALSNSIANLERELGIVLFERDGRSVQLTSQGAEFLKRVTVALNEIDRGLEDIAENREGREGCVHIAAVAAVQRRYLPKLLAGFRRDIGSPVRFDVVQSDTNEAVAGLRDGTFDIAFCGRMANAPDIVAQPFMEQRLSIMVNIEHELAAQDSVSLTEFGSRPLLTYRRGSYMQRALEQALGDFDLNLIPGFDDEIAAAGLVSASPRAAALALDTTDDLRFPHVKTVPVREFKEPFHLVTWSYSRKAALSKTANAFIDYIAAHRNETPYSAAGHRNLLPTP